MHFISSLARGGRERQLATIVSNTDLRQFSTKILFFNKTEKSYIKEYDLSDFTINVESKRKISRLKEIQQIIKSEDPDVVYVWGNGEAMSILLLKHFNNFHFINGSVRHGIRSKKASHYLRSLILHLSKHVVANSEAGLKANNLNRGKILNNGVDEKFLIPLEDRKARRIELTGMPQETVLIISVANLVPYKDYYSVLKALKLLKEKNYCFFYLIIGKGPLQDNLKASITEYGLNNHIRIINNSEEVADYLKISDIFIHSSKGEGCSNAILEAMAAGLPIIASHTGGTPEIINEDNGFLFEYMNHDQIFHQLEICLNDIDLCKKMGAVSANIIKTRYTVESMMSKYNSIIREVVK